ncbi:alpha/beta fold hydrolase [Lentzea sp. NPDC058436]|uniref:alpha/beta fold hydrolase n=1 Tax=Lentzea sp. NPDC058436 TaxID=3346499 RepID=UPI003657B925
MPFVQSNGIRLYHDSFGDPDAPPMVMVMGLGAQLLGWPEEFCELLAGRGFHVIRFDNRDVGLSQWLDDLGDVDLPGLMSGDLSTVRYRLSDMVDDLAGLIGALGLAPVHLVGASMGAGISQQLAVDSPELVRSLASIMSTTSDRSVGQSTLEDPAALAVPPGADRATAIAAEARLHRVIGSPGGETSDEELTRRATVAHDRAHHPAGMFRQLAANATAPDRTEALRTVRVPTAVIHGEDDPLVNVSGGRAVAAAVPGAELTVIPGMGHDLPEFAWERIVDAVVANAARA